MQPPQKQYSFEHFENQSCLLLPVYTVYGILTLPTPQCKLANRKALSLSRSSALGTARSLVHWVPWFPASVPAIAQPLSLARIRRSRLGERKSEIERKRGKKIVEKRERKKKHTPPTASLCCDHTGQRQTTLHTCSQAAFEAVGRFRSIRQS